MSLAAELDIPESGAIFTFGRSHFADNEPSHFFIKNDPVVALACGDDHTAVVCRQGRVFAFGSNGHGQLGLGHKDTVERPACLKWLKPRKVKQVACGRSHTVVLTENNQLYATGDNAEGQLGIGSNEEQLVPQFFEIPGDEGAAVKEIAAGAEHSLVLLENGKAFASGSNSEGQLGIGENIKSSNTFARIALDKPIKSIACGYYHSAALADDGEVYMFGENENQRLGVLHPASKVFLPTPITIGAKISRIHCGQYHTFFLSEEGAAYGVGSNEQGQLGLPRSVIDVNHPTEIGLQKTIVGISCGASHSAFVTSDGSVYTCGDPANHKLCHEDDDFGNNNNGYMPRRVDILEGFRVSDVACGGCHTIIAATKIEGNNANNNNNNDAMPQTMAVHPELPPLQKIPASVMSKQMEVASTPTPTMNGNGNKEGDDKHSLDSLEPYVSGSHILEINELEPIKKEVAEMKGMVESKVAEATHAVDDAKKMALERKETVVEIIEKTVVEVPKKIDAFVDEAKNGVQKAAEDTKEAIADGVQKAAEDTKEAITSGVQKAADETKDAVKGMLKVPEALQHSPIMSTKSAKSSGGGGDSSHDSDHETIACDSEKSSPKHQSKTQAVIPMLRSGEEMVAAVETKTAAVADELDDVVQSKIAGEGNKISKFFSSLKNESCMGKSRVLSATDMKVQAAAHELNTTTQTISDHTNSRACTIL